MAYDFSNYYSVDPWAGITLNERPNWYDGLLRDWYSRAAVYSSQTAFRIELGGSTARTITFNDVMPPRPNIGPIQARAMEATRLYADSWQRQVTTERYGNGFAIHRESEMFTFWQNGQGTQGLMAIIQSYLGQVIVDHLDLLARNAYFRHPSPMFGLNSGSGFGSLNTTTDRMSTDVLDALRLSMKDVSKPYSALPTPFEIGESPVIITTPGVTYDLMREVGVAGGGPATFYDVQRYTEGGRVQLLSGEIGYYRGYRLVENQLAKLWNAGAIVHQTAIKAAVVPGQGAPDPATTLVEGVRRVGQPDAIHYILVQDASGFSPGDMVTIHELRHTAPTLAADGNRGVLNGVRLDDPMKQDVEIHSIDTSGGAGAHKITLKEPYLMTKANGKGLEVDLGGTVFGYITKAQTIHTALVLASGSAQALVCGVAQPPVIYTPPPIDDYMSMIRITYDMWMKYAVWEPRSYRMLFLTGANSLFGRGIFR